MLKFMKTQTTPTAAPTANDLEQRLQAAQASHAQLTADHAQAAYDSLMAAGEPDRVETLSLELAAASRLIETLSAALGVARARELEAARQRRIEGQKAQIERVEKILTRRQKYAEELTGHLTAAMRSWRLLIDNSTRADIASGSSAPLGAALSGGELRRLVEAELYRLGGVPPLSLDQTPSFPGGRPADHALIGTPEKIMPLATAIDQANAYARAHLRGDVPDASVAGDVEATADPVEDAEMAETIPAGPLTDASEYVPVKVRLEV